MYKIDIVYSDPDIGVINSRGVQTDGYILVTFSDNGNGTSTSDVIARGHRYVGLEDIILEALQRISVGGERV